jgi:hypothetical protein
MQIEGPKKNSLSSPTDAASRAGMPAAGIGKAGAKAGAKSFSDILGRAKAGQAPAPQPPSNPVAAGPSGAPVLPARAAARPPVANPAAPPSSVPAEATPENHMDLIRFRMKTGYYNNPQVDDALGDKLSGYFDDAAE